MERGWDRTDIVSLKPKIIMILGFCHLNIRELGYRSGHTLRFPWVAGEPPFAYALRSLTLAFAPIGVSMYILRWFKLICKRLSD